MVLVTNEYMNEYYVAYSDWNNDVTQKGNEIHIGNVVGKYSSAKVARAALTELNYRIAWAQMIKDDPVRVIMPGERELKEKSSSLFLYTMIAYIHTSPYIDVDKNAEVKEYIRNFSDETYPSILQVLYVADGDTVEDFEKNGLHEDSFYILFENLHYTEIGSGEIDYFGGIEKDIEKYEKKKRRSYCKWEQKEGTSTVIDIQTNCGKWINANFANYHEALKEIKYCPYCGKKIKLEEGKENE